MSEARKDIPPHTPQSSDMPARVRVIPYQEGTPDAAATLMLLQLYGDEEGFHCPNCSQLFTNADEAVEHLAQEINAAMLKLAARPGPAEKQHKKEGS